MAYEMRAGQGSLFKNDKKTTDKHPGYKGKLMLPDGRVHYVSMWVKKTAAGEPWFSLSMGEQVTVSQHSQAKADGFQPQPGGDEDIPF
jgi:hypothetical protein